MRLRLLLLSGLVAAAACAAPVHAAAPGAAADKAVLTAGFLDYHPDLRYRLLGMEAMRKDRFEHAFKFFQRAAFYGDKPSQGMVAELLWDGRGTPRDRALAYAWMDLAAERGYVGFLGMRERYWKQLDAAERARAIAEGQSVYARFGDAAAQPRLDAQLRRGRAQMTGSRTGYTGNLQIIVPGPGDSTMTIAGSKFYDKRYWNPAKYREWHDQTWMRPRIGRVDVGDVETMREASRIPASAPDHDAPAPELPETP